MTVRRCFGVVLGALGLLVVMSLLVACDKGPDAEVTVRVVIRERWDDPPRFEAMDPKGNWYMVYVDESTIINSGQADEFAWTDIIQGDDVDLWLNEIGKDEGHKPKHYIALRLDIAPTTR